MKISEHSTKFKSRGCVALRSGLKRLVTTLLKKDFIRKELKRTMLSINVLRLRGEKKKKNTDQFLEVKSDKDAHWQAN